MDELQELKTRVGQLERVITALVFSDRYVFQRDIELLNGRNIQVARETGTQIATAADQKLGFWGATPVARPSQDGTLNGVITALQTIGLLP